MLQINKMELNQKLQLKSNIKQLKENPLNLSEIQNSTKNDSAFQEIFRLMHSRQPLIGYINNRWKLSQWGKLLVN